MDMEPVLDIEVLLKPIPGDNPAGESLMYSGLHDEIREARRAEDDFAQGEWKRETKVADWRRVEALAAEALATRTKDLQVCAWLAEALVKLHGFAGLRDGLRLMRGLHELYWDNLYPEEDEGDLEARANTISWMERQAALALKEVPLTRGAGGQAYGYIQWEESNALNVGPEVNSELAEERRRRAADESKITSEDWLKAKQTTPRAFYEAAHATLGECWEYFQALERQLDEHYRNQAPAMGELKKALDDVRGVVDKIIREKRLLEPDPADAEGSAFEDHRSGSDLASALLNSASTIYFTAYSPAELTPGEWETLLVYVHVPSALGAIQSDSQIRLGLDAKHHVKSRGIETKIIVRGTEVLIVPEMPGCRFNPPRASFLWLEDWHRVEFRLQASPELPEFENGVAANGRLKFYVGPILVGELKFWAIIKEDAKNFSSAGYREVTTDFYQAVFVSYSHKDKYIVGQLEKAYTALGIECLRDLRILRSGEEWGPALLRKIEDAKVFQLCWSSAAKRSAYVEQEWRYALGLGRRAFIRPVFWKKPMPKPPSELSKFLFAYLDFMQ
jgi:type VI secretion system ImpA family protein